MSYAMRGCTTRQSAVIDETIAVAAIVAWNMRELNKMFVSG
jgi:hypothetical protein